MGVFNKLFGTSSKSKDVKQLPWIALCSISQLDTIVKESKAKIQIIFKHSTRCGISRMVLSQFEADYDINCNADLYYLDILSYRDISDQLGYKFQVLHQSPQLLIIKNGAVIDHESHGAISNLDIKQFL